MPTIAPYAKAILGALIAFVGAVAVGYTDGLMTAAEWWTSAGAGLVVLGGVFGVPNAEREAGEGGAVVFGLELIVGFLGGLFLGFLLWHR